MDFNLTKFVSSNKQVIESIPHDKRAKMLQKNMSTTILPVERALGIVWDTANDSFEKMLIRRLFYLISVK